jgi:hypothetical protein
MRMIIIVASVALALSLPVPLPSAAPNLQEYRSANTNKIWAPSAVKREGQNESPYGTRVTRGMNLHRSDAASEDQKKRTSSDKSLAGMDRNLVRDADKWPVPADDPDSVRITAETDDNRDMKRDDEPGSVRITGVEPDGTRVTRSERNHKAITEEGFVLY